MAIGKTRHRDDHASSIVELDGSTIDFGDIVMAMATVKLGWKASVSTDVVKRVLTLAIDGQDEQKIELDAGTVEYTITVQASSSVHFRTTVFDAEGMSTDSVIYDFVIGDLTAPQPDTDLYHEIIGISDEAVLSRRSVRK